jgi:hypothetical protein
MTSLPVSHMVSHGGTVLGQAETDGETRRDDSPPSGSFEVSHNSFSRGFGTRDSSGKPPDFAQREDAELSNATTKSPQSGRSANCKRAETKPFVTYNRAVSNRSGAIGSEGCSR